MEFANFTRHMNILLEQEWFIQVLYGFDDNKVFKNNWNTNI